VAGQPARAAYFDCSVVYDEFDSLMNKQFLVEPDRYVSTVVDRFTQENYQSLQRGLFTLYSDRDNAGIIIFHTNENLHGKLLYHFSEPVANETHLLIDEVMLFARVEDGYGPVSYGPLRVKPKFGVDLDTGNSFVLVEEGSANQEQKEQTHADLAYRVDPETGGYVIEAINQAVLHFPVETLCHRPGAAARPSVNPGQTAPATTTSPARSIPLPPQPPVLDAVPPSRLPARP